MQDPPFLFDAVVFDLDGTLVATDQFWVDAARAGAKRAFQELKLEREMPSAEQWMMVVGLPLALGFELVFPDLTAEQRARVLARCVEEENRALRAGRAALMPGAAETLADLRARGVRLGVASNCGQSYLDTVMNELGLARYIEAARCLDSPRVQSKGGMVADLLETFQTRAAVMVGDRLSDRDAAWENGLPHVHVTRGFARYAAGTAAGGEEVQCEAQIDDLTELAPRLARRGTWIEGTLKKLGYFAKERPRTLGITGHSGSGKTLFARDVARVLALRDVPVAVVALEDFARPLPPGVDLSVTAFMPRDRPLDHLGAGFDVDELVQGVLEPHARGEDVERTRGGKRIAVPANAALVLQGPFLLHPKLRPLLAKVIYLEVTDPQSLRRVAGRDARASGPESVLRVRRHALPSQRAFDEVCSPRELADEVLEAENALGPE